MQKWLARIRGAVLMALIWAVIWAPFGPLAGLIVDPDGTMDEPWILIGAIPGFLCGLLFSVVLGITERRRAFHELSLARVAAWGAAGGLVLMGLNAAALGTPNTEHLFWRARFLIMGGVTVLSAASAAGTLLLARMAKKKDALQTAGSPAYLPPEPEPPDRAQGPKSRDTQSSC